MLSSNPANHTTTTSSSIPPISAPPPHDSVPVPVPAPAAASFSAAILASIFLLAARIMSSLLLRSSACLSSLLALHPSFFPGSPSSTPASSSDPPSLFCRLYRVMRSGCCGLAGCFACAWVLAGAVVEPGGGGGWKVIGGCRPSQ